MTNTRPNRLRRSELSTPATSGARANIVAGFNNLDWGHTVRGYRINGVATPWCHGDIIEVISSAGPNVDVIVVPKVKAPRDVWFADDLLTQLERKLGLDEGRIGLELLIEETEALACVEQLAACCDRLEALILGVGDLAASQGIRGGRVGMPEPGGSFGGYPGDMWHYARNRTIVAACANGLDAIDGPSVNLTDVDGCRRDAIWSATLGAVGKWCIHPRQVAIANDVFTPTVEEIKVANDALSTLHAAEANGVGSMDYQGKMIAGAVTRVLDMVLDRARLCGLGGIQDEAEVSDLHDG
jgi:citrate lyase subunit beta/citryl-CoA lyase